MEGKELFHGAGCARARTADIQPVDSPNLIPLILLSPKKEQSFGPGAYRVGERGRASRPRAADCRRRQSRAALLLWVDARARSAPSVRLLAPPRARASSDVRPATRGLRERLRDERHDRRTCGTFRLWRRCAARQRTAEEREAQHCCRRQRAFASAHPASIHDVVVTMCDRGEGGAISHLPHPSSPPDGGGARRLWSPTAAAAAAATTTAAAAAAAAATATAC